MESGTSGLLDKLKAGIWKILKKEQEESKKKQVETEDQKKLKQECWTDELRDLAPVDDIEDFDTYEKMLNWAFLNKRVKNIALSGPYGSGKSSIIETYLRRHKGVRETTLKVSMATFTCGKSAQKDIQNSSENPNGKDKNDISEDELETTILKQLFYKVSPKKIPQSSYRRLRIRNRIESLFAIFFTLLIASIVSGIIFPDISKNYFGLIDFVLAEEKFKTPLYRIAEWMLFVIVTSCVVEIVFGIRVFKMHMKEFLVFKSASIEDRTTESDSVFNRNLDEILYFFEKTKFRTVFFEDIDRTNNDKIFIHLHELNYILNNDEVIKNKPVKFVYAIREDYFSAESKTKFFDFIIPVIPIVDATNSFAKLIRNIREARNKGIKHDITEEFAMEIGLFISDMRMLLNVYNEFLVYKQALKNQMTHGLSDEKMFAMMAFKNMYPREFAKVQVGKGALKQAFIDKNRFIEMQLNDLNDEMIEARNKRDEKVKGIRILSRMISEIDKNKGMKRLEHILAMDEKNYKRRRSEIIGKSLKDLLNENEVTKVISKSVCQNSFLVFLLSQGYIDEGYTNYINYFYAETIGEEMVGEAERRFILNAKRQQPEDLGYGYKLNMPSVVITYLDAEILGKQGVCNFDVFRELIKKKKIDKLRKAIKTLADNPDTDVSWKFIEEFRHRESTDISNAFADIVVDTWDGLWGYISENIRVIHEDIQEIKEKSPEELRTIITKGLELKCEGEYITTLFGSRLYFFKKVLERKGFRLSLDERNSVKKHLQHDKDILHKLGVDVSTDKDYLMEFGFKLSVLGIKFKRLNFSDVSDEFVRMIVDDRNYSINLHTINSIVSYIAGSKNCKRELNIRPYSTIVELKKNIENEIIRGKGDTSLEAAISDVTDIDYNKLFLAEELLGYIRINMEVFVNNIVLTRRRLRDDPADVMDMVWRMDGRLGIQSELIRKEEFKLDDITIYFNSKNGIDAEDKCDQIHVWKAILENDKVKADWKNLLEYCKECGFDDTLKRYFMRHASELNERPADSEIDQSLQNFLQSGFEEMIE